MAARDRVGSVWAAATLALCALNVPALAQPLDNPQDRPGGSVAAADPESPAMRVYAEHQKRRVAAEKVLKKIRHKHFGTISNIEIRQVGIAQLREFTEPALYPSLIEIFKNENDDVRAALIDHFADRETHEGDASLAWMAVYDRDPAMRALATDRLRTRTSALGSVPATVKLVIQGSLKKDNEQVVAAAGQLARGLGVFEAIPWLIAAQVGGSGGPTNALSGVDRKGDLAWIVVGRQIAFVSDLTPVVADSAVAFDPTVSVLTEGVILRIQDAAVVTYRTEIHGALVDLSTRDWGRPTDNLGWDQNAWRRWYNEEYRPFLLARADASKASGPSLPPPAGGP